MRYLSDCPLLIYNFITGCVPALINTTDKPSYVYLSLFLFFIQKKFVIIITWNYFFLYHEELKSNYALM